MIKIRKIISVIPFPSYSELIGNLYVAKLSIPHACLSAFVGAHTSNYQTPRLGFLTSRSIYKSLYELKKYHQWVGRSETKPRRLTSTGVGRSKSCELTNAGVAVFS